MTKVKIPRPEPRKPNKLTVVFGATIATIFLLILGKFLIDRKPEPVDTKNPRPVSSPKAPEGKPAATGVSTVESPFKNLKDVGLNERQMANIYLHEKNIHNPQYQRLLAQGKLLTEFKKKTHLNLDYPVALNYIELDLDPDVVSILGTSTDGKKNFGVIATTHKVSVETALAYLKENTAAFNFVGNHKFLPEKMISIKAPESTGLGDLKIVPSTTTGSLQSFYVALAPRKDGKGTYLFMLEAPYYEFDRNEEGLEKILHSMKAAP